VTHDAIVVGGGVNGLVCAALLGRAGRRVLVLEARNEAGGCAATWELAPGFLVPRLAHATGPLAGGLLAALRISDRDLSFMPCPVDIAGLMPDGRPVVLYDDTERTGAELGRRSARDGRAWPAFAATRAALARVVGSTFDGTPPSIDRLDRRSARHMLATARACRSLSTADRQQLLRWTTMSAADVVGEYFADEGVRATVAADCLFGAMLGPRSAGGGLRLMLAAANAATGEAGTRFVRGGPGRLAGALAGAVRAAGGEVRVGARVAHIRVRDDRVAGVVLENGDDLACRTVVSAIDPRHTLLDLCDPEHLTPEFLWRMRHYRMRGVLAKVNMALSALPVFPGAAPEMLSGRVRIGPDLDYLERAFDNAKYGRYSPSPWIELTLPSLLDPGLAPPGAHVLSAYIQWAPYDLRGRSWDDERDGLYRTVLETLERYAPGIGRLVVGAETLTPLDLERDWGLTGGDIFHGELALDQFVTMRPLLGWAAYSTPIAGLHLCGSGTHPGTGLTGASGRNAAAAMLKG
jgi:phytoene dehydrogenase-like protein